MTALQRQSPRRWRSVVVVVTAVVVALDGGPLEAARQLDLDLAPAGSYDLDFPGDARLVLALDRHDATAANDLRGDSGRAVRPAAADALVGVVADTTGLVVVVTLARNPVQIAGEVDLDLAPVA